MEQKEWKLNQSRLKSEHLSNIDNITTPLLHLISRLDIQSINPQFLYSVILQFSLCINYEVQKFKGKAQGSVEGGRGWMGWSGDGRQPPTQMHQENYLLIFKTTL